MMKKLIFLVILICLKKTLLLGALSVAYPLDTVPNMDDTSKVNALLQMAANDLTPKTSLEKAKMALEIEKRYNYKNRLAVAYRKVGNVYFERFSKNTGSRCGLS